MIVVLTTACSLSLSAFDIVVDGKPKAVIIRGNRSMLCMLAVESLRTAVLKCTGVELQVLLPKDAKKVPESMNRIFVGDCSYAASRGFKGQDLQLEEYWSKVVGKDLFFVGHDRVAPDMVPRGSRSRNMKRWISASTVRQFCGR